MSSMSGKESGGQMDSKGRKGRNQSVWRIAVGRKGRKQVVRDLLLSVSIYLTDDSMLWFMV